VILAAKQQKLKLRANKRVQPTPLRGRKIVVLKDKAPASIGRRFSVLLVFTPPYNADRRRRRRRVAARAWPAAGRAHS
jgi:hypothetical protein